MRWRDQLALTLPALILRIVLAITFLWAGTGKLVGTTTVQGDDAARLTNLGVSLRAPAPEPEPDTPSEEDIPFETLPEEVINPATSHGTPPNDPTKVSKAVDINGVQFTFVQDSHAPAVGSDFPEALEVRRVYIVALLLDRCANPGLTKDSTPMTPLLPSWMGSGSAPVIAAWSAAITELLAGLLLLLGLLTRLGAIATLSVMLVAMWTTTIGPAALHANDSILGFIPSKPDVWAPPSYNVELWQFALAGVSLALFLLGPGPLSLDRLLFRSSRDMYVKVTPPRANKKRHASDPNP